MHFREHDIYQINKFLLLFNRVQQVHEKWVNIRTLLQTKLINILNIHTNPDFKFLAECTEWVHQKLVSSKFLDLINPILFTNQIQGSTNARSVGINEE